MSINRSFTGIISEGGLLPSDFLLALSDPQSGIKGLDPVTYGLSPGERIGEQVNRSWNRLKGCWANFQSSVANKLPGEFTTTETRALWLLPLFHELDFGRLAASRPIEIDGKSYPVSHGWGSVPIHLVGTHLDLDRRTPGAIGAAKASPHSLVQQVLNASKEHVWGIISNGYTLRLLRDNVALTRISYVEWDLQTIFDADIYPEFFLLWLVCHQSRFEAPEDGRSDQCWLEKWKKQAEEKGLRALENLRPGVERAIEAIGAGLVSHKANNSLRTKLSSGELSTQDFYHQILRVIYRMLFLFVAEDRGLLHPPLPREEAGKNATSEALRARRRYKWFYSIGRLRSLTIHRAGTPHPDLWQVFQLITKKLGSDEGCPEIALPALGSFLWSQESTPDLNDCLLSNRYLLEAAHALAFVRDGNVRRAIDYKNLGSEELGSVYEGLLELHPLVNANAGSFELKISAGHERKTSGSYYTPDSLVQCLLDSAIEPVITEAINGKEGPAAADSLLKLKICDPAVGSGHFLIAAAHRIARRVASARTGEEEPSPEATREAIRDVIAHCLYGVDINPMAAELCRVSLWLEALEPGKPLSFLDHHIRVGNSLHGVTPELIAAGLPDQAFNPIEGDDKKLCSALKKQNKRELAGQRGMLHLMGAESKAGYSSIKSRTRGIDQAPDNTIQEVRRKAEEFHRLVVSPEYRHAQQIADAWCAAFVWRKQADAPFEAITTDAIRRLENDPNALDSNQQSEVERISLQYQFFHWHLAFPEVFNKGGFDCVLGNPPWEHTELKEKEWFAERRPEIANARTGADRKRMIEALKEDDSALYTAFSDDLRLHDGMSHFLGNSGRYLLCGRGRINLYAVFAENMRNLLNDSGRVGCVLPTGIATDDTTKFFFQEVVDKKSLVSLYDFENKGIFFPGVHSSYKFCLFTSGHGLRPTSDTVEFVFFAHTIEDLHDPERRFTLSAEDILLLNPNTRTCPIFRSRRDAELAKTIYRRVPVLVREPYNGSEEQNPWAFSIRRIFNMGIPEVVDLCVENPTPEEQGLLFPMLEAKLIHQFDHRFASYKGDEAINFIDSEKIDADTRLQPRFWLPISEVNDKLAPLWNRRWLFVWRDICRNTDERTVIATVLPLSGTDFTLRVGFPAYEPVVTRSALLANWNAIIFDYCNRQVMGGTHLSDYITKQLPTLPPSSYEEPPPFDEPVRSVRDWLLPRVLELAYTAWDLEPFAQDCGWFSPPFKWDEVRRFQLRCELDAALFHLYLPTTADGQWKPARVANGAMRDETPEELAKLRRLFPTPRDAVRHIIDTFPIIRRKDEEKYGDFRTKRVILEIYDAMQESIRTGISYQTILAPPPGPLKIDLPEWKPGHPKPVNWPSHIHPPKGCEHA
jgi:hypothetical protein